LAKKNELKKKWDNSEKIGRVLNRTSKLF